MPDEKAALEQIDQALERVWLSHTGKPLPPRLRGTSAPAATPASTPCLADLGKVRRARAAARAAFDHGYSADTRPGAVESKRRDDAAKYAKLDRELAALELQITGKPAKRATTAPVACIARRERVI